LKLYGAFIDLSLGIKVSHSPKTTG